MVLSATYLKAKDVEEDQGNHSLKTKERHAEYNIFQARPFQGDEELGNETRRMATPTGL